MMILNGSDSNDQAEPATGKRPPVFIVGGSRTGSEMLKTMLSVSPMLDFVDEMRLLMPAWLHRDLASTIDQHFGSLAKVDSAQALVELLFSGKPTGWFWSAVDSQLDRKMFAEELGQPPYRLAGLFESIMRAHARTHGKRGIGAKFPVHYSYTDRLVEWFPDCRIIHTTRHPKAVYLSQARKHGSDSRSIIAGAYSRFQQFAHINIQTTGTARLHRRFRGSANYCLVRYEDIVRSPEETLRNLCCFLQVEFLSQMLMPNQYGSSFNTIGSARGIDPSSLDRWQEQLSPFESRLIDIFQRRSTWELGYPPGRAKPVERG
jgi:hypothetical protein